MAYELPIKSPRETLINILKRCSWERLIRLLERYGYVRDDMDGVGNPLIIACIISCVEDDTIPAGEVFSLSELLK